MKNDPSNTSYMVAWINIYTGEYLTALTPDYQVRCNVEALKGQGCPVGYWSLAAWQRFRNGAEEYLRR